jgi:hypothetical protein
MRKAERTRRTSRTAARTTALVAVLAASGLAAGAAAAVHTGASSGQALSTALSYRCAFPAGPRRVQVTVSVSLPAAGKAGRPIRPGRADLTMTLPPRAVAGLAGLRWATVRAATRLTVSAAQGPARTSVIWPGATRRAVPVPPHGALSLRATGQAPPVTASGSGEVVLTAAGLSLALTPGKAISTSPRSAPSRAPTFASSGPDRHPGATPPPVSSPPSAALQVNCVLTPGQRAVLATVAVSGTKAPRPRATPTTGVCPKHGKLKLNPLFPHPKPAKGAKRLNSVPQDGCAVVVGYSDIRKLKGAALIGPAVSDILTNVLVFFRPPNAKKHDKGYLQLDNVIQLEDHGKHEFPPSTATFLSFGFVPTSATMHIEEIGAINAFAVGVGESCNTCQQTTTVLTRARVRIDNVRVNGVPLDVGNSCQTSPFNIIVVGSILSKPPYSVNLGGPLTGMVTIPNFSGCGVGENLNSIFNAAISGDRNFTLLTQGVECTVSNAFGCDPKTGKPIVPKPLRKVSN